MARTKRFYPYHWLRRPKTLNQKKGEMAAFEAILDAFSELGIQLPYSNRLQARAHKCNKDIPSAWDDISQACWGEIWKTKN